MLFSFGLIGLVHSRRGSIIGPHQHHSDDFQVPLKFETFFFSNEEEESSYSQLS